MPQGGTRRGGGQSREQLVKQQGEKADTKRAWALDFRCASVRAHSGGAGVLAVIRQVRPATSRLVRTRVRAGRGVSVGWESGCH